MKYVRFAVLFALCSGVAANAATLRLRAEDHGIWGAELRACKGRVSRSQCARITPLVMADNGIEMSDLHRLPIGRKINIRELYLEPGFEVSRETLRQAKLIFSEPEPEATPSSTTPTIIEKRSADEELERMISSLREANALLESKTARLSEETDLLRKSAVEAKGKQSDAESRSSKLELLLKNQPKPKARWLIGLEYAAASFVGGGLVFVFCLWWFKVFERNNRILPLMMEVTEDDGTPHLFRLREDNTYDCLDCEKEMKYSGPSARERGKRIRYENLERHIKEVTHPKAVLLDPIERSA